MYHDLLDSRHVAADGLLESHMLACGARKRSNCVIFAQATVVRRGTARAGGAVGCLGVRLNVPSPDRSSPRMTQWFLIEVYDYFYIS